MAGAWAYRRAADGALFQTNLTEVITAIAAVEASVRRLNR